MVFRRGDQVEVSSKEDGFAGSYFLATIVSELTKEEYIVQYMTLLKEDKFGPLREIVAPNKIRLVSPEIPATGFDLRDRWMLLPTMGGGLGRLLGKLGQSTSCVFSQLGMRVLTL
ncbi:hypothetical protein RJ640_008995 [Escallonia rubra]|uniref:Agenet domain-containing protein n=1 Tax=Escallonia rubra TaxID=112253 RepID=A0AA88RT54_9ASTE|nr:hypothetical protein RJ640_008995 [Escallonia rubra]